ncbi:MAG: ATP-binding protein [Nitratireductor sp.]
MSIHDPKALLEELCSETSEREWFEFKKSNFEPEKIGEYVSAISNSCMLLARRAGYVVWGVDNKTHEIVGTDVNLKIEKVKGEEFEHWLNKLLKPKVGIEFHTFWIGGKRVEIIEITPGYEQPVRFLNNAYIRVNSITKRLDEYPQKERTLWSITSRYSFEDGIAGSHQNILDIEDSVKVYGLYKMLFPDTRVTTNVIRDLLSKGLIIDDNQGAFDITNLFALTAANDISKFTTIANKAPRVTIFNGTSKLKTKKDIIGKLGYAVGFRKLMKFIMENIPQREVIEHGIRRKKYEYPEIAIREILANALVHQDFTIDGTHPLVEIFDDKIEITNAGTPLIDLDRFIDHPSKSRNEKLTSLFREIGICETRGSGIDKAIWEIEKENLPPPLFKVVGENTVVTLYRKRKFAETSKEDRLRACYQHACIRQQVGDLMSNSSLRDRLGLDKNQYPQVSVVIREAIESDLIRPLSADQGNRNARYVPFWA